MVIRGRAPLRVSFGGGEMCIRDSDSSVCVCIPGLLYFFCIEICH